MAGAALVECGRPVSDRRWKNDFHGLLLAWHHVSRRPGPANRVIPGRRNRLARRHEFYSRKDRRRDDGTPLLLHLRGWEARISGHSARRRLPRVLRSLGKGSHCGADVGTNHAAGLATSLMSTIG